MAKIRVKNFEKFQHFKDRRPPWIKIYREVLDDVKINSLKPEVFKFLIQAWLIASEDESKKGYLPEIDQLAFRLRYTVLECRRLLGQIDNFLITTCHQDGSTETETETETEAETETETKRSRASVGSLFLKFWDSYPKKKSKGAAEKAFKALKPDEQLVETMISKIDLAKTSADWTKEGGQFIPHPATWLRAKGWDDEISTATTTSGLDAWIAGQK